MSKPIRSSLSPELSEKLRKLQPKNGEEMLEVLNKEEIFEMFVNLTRNHRLLRETNKYNAEVATAAHEGLQLIKREAKRPMEDYEDYTDKFFDIDRVITEKLDSVNAIRTRQRLVIEGRIRKAGGTEK